MDVLLVIDMQKGLFSDTPRFDATGVIRRINTLSDHVRQTGGVVVFIQHDGVPGDPIETNTPGWQILSELHRKPDEKVFRKTACDAFYRTNLHTHLQRLGATRLIFTGCATEFCVDTSIRSAASLDYDLTVISDGHTTGERPHLDAESIIRHHNWVWENLILPERQVEVVSSESFFNG